MKICLCGQKHSMGGHTLLKDRETIVDNLNEEEKFINFKNLYLIFL